MVASGAVKWVPVVVSAGDDEKARGAAGSGHRGSLRVRGGAVRGSVPNLELLRRTG
ncbi:hypothetical protein GCM10009629_12160 [Pseudonocardia alni]